MVAREGVIRRLNEARVPAPTEERRSLPERIAAGRLIELTGDAASATLTAAVSLVIHAQRAGEPAVWIQPEGGTLYPPDLAANGVDLSTLVVVHVPGRAGMHGLARAAELLLRSGAFGLAVIDLSGGVPRGDAWQGRLASLARQHEASVVVLRESSDGDSSLGPMITMRISATRERRSPGKFAVAYRILKDKTGHPGNDPAPEPRRAPCGLP